MLGRDDFVFAKFFFEIVEALSKLFEFFGLEIAGDEEGGRGGFEDVGAGVL